MMSTNMLLVNFTLIAVTTIRLMIIAKDEELS